MSKKTRTANQDHYKVSGRAERPNAEELERHKKELAEKERAKPRRAPNSLQKKEVDRSQ